MGLFVISSKHNGGHEILQPYTGTTIDDLNDPTSLAESLCRAMSHPKTRSSSLMIRQSVQHLDFPNQLEQIVQACL